MGPFGFTPRSAPGLLESAYATCLAYELRERGYTVRDQVPLPVVYKNIHLPVGYRVDLIVEESVDCGDQDGHRAGPNP